MLVTRVSNIAQTLDALKSEGVWTAGLESLPDSKVYTEADLKGPLALVVGSEAEGLARLVRETCDLLIRIPMRGRVSSLNAATAAAVALYEVRRQRDRDSG
jgi:23S rRNA (guanosine2251-2'-O)-methyltransferase